MIERLLDFCLKERLVVIVASVAIIAFGWYSTKKVPVDAIPNVGENQVIVLTDWPGRSPKDIEDQITYPLSIALQAVPGAESVRGKSMFGFSFVQVTFADNVDFYWARSRVAEQLTTVGGSLPDDVTPTLAPDATALGQVFYYVLIPPDGMDLAEQRSKQDFFIKYALQSVEGVAEVASIGGYERQYQVEVNPDRLRYHNLTLSSVLDSVRAANVEVGAKTVESGGMEYLIRGKGFLGSDRTPTETIDQIEQTVLATRDGVPIRVRDVADVQLGPAFRRGALDYNGSEAVGGVVVMRYGENPREVIDRVKAKIASLEPELGGIEIRGIYDRTELISETIETLTDALSHETAITIAVMVLFLLHVRASLVIAITLPMAVLMSFAFMKVFHVDANIMSLAGIAIAIGTMVDMGIIILENIYSALAEWENEGRPGGAEERLRRIGQSARDVVPAVVTAVMTTIVSFLPVFFLTGRDHRLFAPLAWTKTFALASALIVAVTVVPMLCRVFLVSRRPPIWRTMMTSLGFASIVAALCWFVWTGNPISEHVPTNSLVSASRLTSLTELRDRIPLTDRTLLTLLAATIAFFIAWWMSRESIRPMESNPVSRFVRWLYAARLRMALDHKVLFMAPAALIVILGLGAWFGMPTVLQPFEKLCRKLGTELNDLPGYVDAKHLLLGLKSDDWIALDEGSWFYMPSLYPAASFSQAMRTLQTQDALIKEIPEVADVLGKIGRVESALDPAPAAMVETYVMLKPKSEWREGIVARDIWDEINRVATLPGVTPASALQPIEGRVVMLQSGIKAAMAIRIYGESLEGLSQAAVSVADHLKSLQVVNSGTVSPDIVLGKPYIEFEVDREEAARYGMTTMMVNEVVAAGLGGVNVTSTVEGRERYPIQVRYSRDVRENVDELPKVAVVTHTEEVVQLERLAQVETTWGPGAINSEDARLVAHVSFSPTGAIGDLETVDSVMQSLRSARENGDLAFPDGNFELQPVGSFENQIEANRRLMWLVPTVLLINFFLHYLHFRNVPISLVVFSGIPVSFAGGMVAVAVMGVDMNTAIWVGFIALFGLAADDGIVIASYIKQVLERRQIQTVPELREAIYEAGLKRIRPCVMTTVTTLAALLPVLLSTGRGADVAKAMALPVFGGMLIEPFTSFIVPTMYCAYMEFKLNLGLADGLLEQGETPMVRQQPSVKPEPA
jgi:Cu(I)/Ag(I) efflux system membrane protein CusA/SilA